MSHDADFELLIPGRRRTLVPGFEISRVLPYAKRRNVGPFVFLDRMGPLELAPGGNLDVAPHPHIGLATLTYLFEGALMHRDSTGAVQRIEPGAVNWMAAGRGVVHSERTPDELREQGGRVHGLQAWVALPLAHEDDEPSFHHHDPAALPELALPGARLRLVAGSSHGLRSPVPVHSPLVFAELHVEAGATLELSDEHEELGVYVLAGELAGANGSTIGEDTLALLHPGPRCVHARRASHVVLLGGAPLDAPRFIEWNFVASSRERIEAAKRAWLDDGFPRVPGEHERIPLPG